MNFAEPFADTQKKRGIDAPSSRTPIMLTAADLRDRGLMHGFRTELLIVLLILTRSRFCVSTICCCIRSTCSFFCELSVELLVRLLCRLHIIIFVVLSHVRLSPPVSVTRIV